MTSFWINAAGCASRSLPNCSRSALSTWICAQSTGGSPSRTRSCSAAGKVALRAKGLDDAVDGIDGNSGLYTGSALCIGGRAKDRTDGDQEQHHVGIEETSKKPAPPFQPRIPECGRLVTDDEAQKRDIVAEGVVRKHGGTAHRLVFSRML